MAFNKPSTGDPVAATDINQIIESLDGSGATGEPIKHTKVNDAANYALDVQNLDPVAGYGLRVRDPNGLDVLKTDKDQIDIGKDIVAAADVLMDGVDVGAHTHTGVAGHGPQIPEGGIANGAVTEAKIGAGAVTEAKLGAGAVTTAKIGNAQVTQEKLWADIATQGELDAHTGASAAVHGLGAGSHVVGTKAGAARRLEIAGDSWNMSADGDFTITAVWENEFAAIVAVVSAAGAAAGGSRRLTATRTLVFSTTSVSHAWACSSGSGTTTFVEYFIGVGT